jgi:hypothetical protein
MKKHQTSNIKLLLFLLLISFTNIGCENDICYSCDTEIDAWAKNNIESLKLLSRNELVLLTSEKQKAAFRTFTPEKRKQLWTDKLKQIKSLNFSKKELNHLKKIEIFLTQYDFSNELSRQEEIYLKSWFEEGQQKFNWNIYFLVSGFASLDNAVLSKTEFQKEFSKEFTTLSSNLNEFEGQEDSCDCRWDITCQLAGLGDCSDGGCEDSAFGCGFMFMQSCTNDCSG